MEVTTLVAIYAAVVATAAVLVQLAVWRSTRTQVRLRVNPGTGPVQGESDGAGGVYTKEADVVFIEITNRSGHLVKISQVWAVRADNPERSFVFPWPYPTHQRLPLEIPARDSRNVWVLQEGLRLTCRCGSSQGPPPATSSGQSRSWSMISRSSATPSSVTTRSDPLAPPPRARRRSRPMRQQVRVGRRARSSGHRQAAPRRCGPGPRT